MHRRKFMLGLAGAVTIAAVAAAASPRIHPHERLSEFWAIMGRNRSGPAAMRAAVEKEFGAGELRFEGVVLGDRTVVLIDTASIDFDDRFAYHGRPDVVTAKCRIVEPPHRRVECAGMPFRCAA